VTLLSLRNVGKTYTRGLRVRVALRDVSLDVDPGEMVVVWGARRSGRTSLVRVAAGLEEPGSGSVSFYDVPPSRELGRGIGVWQKRLDAGSVVEQVAVPLLARRMSTRGACVRAREVLRRVGFEVADADARDLDGAEAARVCLARALVGSPSLLVADDPTDGVEIMGQEGIVDVLRSLASDGLAMLLTTGEMRTAVAADVVLTLRDGVLSAPMAREVAPVIPFPRSVPRQVG
jgi:ABC-type lipoprotein export system ATPase subunit